jgi:hypothetical protein
VVLEAQALFVLVFALFRKKKGTIAYGQGTTTYHKVLKLEL